MLHGNPTWGFLWRKVVAALPARVCGIVVPDLVGLGRSSRAARRRALARAPRRVARRRCSISSRPVRSCSSRRIGAARSACARWRIGRRALARHRARQHRGRRRRAPASSRRCSIGSRGCRSRATLLFAWLGFPLGVLHLSQGDRSRSAARSRARIAGRCASVRIARRRSRSLAWCRFARSTIRRSRRSRVPSRCFAQATVPVALVWGTKDPMLGRVVEHMERLRPDAQVTRTAGRALPAGRSAGRARDGDRRCGGARDVGVSTTKTHVRGHRPTTRGCASIRSCRGTSTGCRGARRAR